MKYQFKYIAAAFLFSGMVTAQSINVDQMPKPGPTPTINIAKPKTFTLKNGLTVMVVENSKLPRVSTTLTMDRQPIFEGTKAGVSQIMAGQLGEGTTKVSKDDFNKRIDFLGAGLDFSSGGASANSLSKYYPEVLSMMADAIINPRFDVEEINKSKDRMIEGLKADEKNASSIASKVNRAVMYGKNTSRGEFNTAETIKNVQLADVQDFYKKYYAPNNAYLVIVGDVKFEDVKKQVERDFSAWKKSDVKFGNLEPVATLAATEIDVVDVPNAVQSVVNVGNTTDLKMNSKQYFPAVIANYILGGGGEARLFMNLREKNGFTYGAYSSLNTGKYGPTFAANASVRNEVTDKAVVEFMNELKAINTVKPEELTSAKAKLKGDFIRSLESPATIARFALSQKTQDLPENFYTDYLKSIDAVTAGDISNAVKSFIKPNQSRIFVAGKAAEIADGLEKLGYPVKYYDTNANPTTKPEAQKVDASVSVASVMDKYIAAIGGKAALEKITSVTTKATGTVQGMQLDLKTIEANGGKNLSEVSMGGNVVQKIFFDGKNGGMSMQGQSIPLPEETKAEFLNSTTAIPELGYAKNPNAKISGSETFNNEDCYVVKVGATSYFYSKKTGLKVGKQMTAQGQTVNVKFADYKDVSGVKFPQSITQAIGPMEMVFNVSSIELNKATDADFK